MSDIFFQSMSLPLSSFNGHGTVQVINIITWASGGGGGCACVCVCVCLCVCVCVCVCVCAYAAFQNVSRPTILSRSRCTPSLYCLCLPLSFQQLPPNVWPLHTKSTQVSYAITWTSESTHCVPKTLCSAKQIWESVKWFYHTHTHTNAIFYYRFFKSTTFITQVMDL
jgi:hypothetical protein